MNGELLNFYWGLPFLGVLFSLSLGPSIAPKFWHEHSGKVLGVWSLSLVIGLGSAFGFLEVLHRLRETLLGNYFPFIIFLGTLYILSGGLWIRAKFEGCPFKNTCLLGFGTLLASLIGTTGALVLLIRPLLQANKRRISRTHLVVFLIILVGNIGGALTPLGDPPLFLGYLEGVDFFWVSKNLGGPFLMMAVPILVLFYITDRFYWKKERSLHHPHIKEKMTFEVTGKLNFFLLLGVVCLLLGSRMWKDMGTLDMFRESIPLSSLLRDGGFLVLAILSWVGTPKTCRAHNGFSWGPLQDVTKVFFNIFITLIPVLLILEAKEKGSFHFLVQFLETGGGTSPAVAYFWLTGFFSAFLDNAPTYLVFFKAAGADAKMLMTEGSKNLIAISCGAVFMGALTYIGNAPNFMAKDIAEEIGIKMPSFFKYMAWVSVILLPLLGGVMFFFLL